MTNETIGHYASHSGSNTVGWTKDKGFYGDIQKRSKQFEEQTSDLELKIRKEVMDAVGELHKGLHTPLSLDNNPFLIRLANHAHTIKDRLNLLWGK